MSGKRVIDRRTLHTKNLVQCCARRWFAKAMVAVTVLLSLGGMSASLSAQIRLPAIDPTGASLFLPRPYSTEILSPFGRNQVTVPPPAQPVLPGQQVPSQQIIAPAPGPVSQPAVILPQRNTGPVIPAFQTPPDAPVCSDGRCGIRKGLHHPRMGPLQQRLDKFHKGRTGEIIMTPHRIVAPVNSEVIVLAGICGEDGYYVINQPLEWMLSQDSAGQIIEVGGLDHAVSNQLIKPSARKIDGDYAWGRTLIKPRLITRGTPTPVDDIAVAKGQAWISLSSASEGTSYLTCVAPKAKAWDKRRASTIIHWVDANWMIPAPSRATAGTVFPLTVNVNRSSDGTGVADYKIRYQIVGGVPAEFAPSGTQQAEVATNTNGQATVQIRQPAGQAVAGATQVRVDVIRPAVFGQRELVMESGITSIFWSTPALTIRTIGPSGAGIDQPFEYRVEVTNPGDQVARDVVVRSSDLSGEVQYVSSNPKPTQFGNEYQWNLGQIAPGGPPQVITVQMKSNRAGANRICFEVASSTDNLQTEACAETTIAAPCIGLKINGPTAARTGDTINFDFQITNQCNEPLENVTMEVRFDDGLVAPGFPSPIVTGPVPSIPPGGDFPVPTLSFVAQQPGRRCFNVLVKTEDGNSVSTAQRCIDVTQVEEAKVRVSMESYRVVRVGDEILVRMAVDNLGNVPLENVTVINQFSDSMLPLRRSATPMRWIGDDLAFDIGRMEPNTRSVIEIVFRGQAVDGNAESKATVVTPIGQSDTTSVSIRIEPADAVLDGGAGQPGGNSGGVDEGPIGVPGGQGGGTPTPAAGQLTVDVRALDNSIRVGENTRFQVTVRNNGTTPIENVDIVLLVPTGTILQDAGSTQSDLRVLQQSPDGTRVVLETRRVMRGGEVISFPVTVRAVNIGQSTFAANVTSAGSPLPIEGKDTITIVQQ